MSERPGFWLRKWSDETSQYDPKGRWQCGSECYMVDYEMWIPDSITPENEDAINSYIDAEWDRQSEVQDLRDEVARLRGALEPFAERWEYFERTKHPSGGEWPESLEYADDEPSAIYLGQLKAAKAALTVK